MRAASTSTIAKTCHDGRHGARAHASHAKVHWRDTPLIRMRDASEILGLSVASLYRLAHEGKLVLKKLEGRTLVETRSLIEVADSASDWTPSTRTAAAISKRATRSKDSWETVR